MIWIYWSCLTEMENAFTWWFFCVFIGLTFFNRWLWVPSIVRMSSLFKGFSVIVLINVYRWFIWKTCIYVYVYIFFLSWVFFHKHSRITGLQGKSEGISLTPHYHFQPLHRHLDIGQAITAKSSLLHIASIWTRTGNFWFSSASR